MSWYTEKSFGFEFANEYDIINEKKRWIISGRCVTIVDNLYYLLCVNTFISLIPCDLETCRLKSTAGCSRGELTPASTVWHQSAQDLIAWSTFKRMTSFLFSFPWLAREAMLRRLSFSCCLCPPFVLVQLPVHWSKCYFPEITTHWIISQLWHSQTTCNAVCSY